MIAERIDLEPECSYFLSQLYSAENRINAKAGLGLGKSRESWGVHQPAASLFYYGILIGLFAVFVALLWGAP